ncbi:MAG TPA: HAMP domain-containing sensor histidine kinase [Gemmatimonadaceae bacterium]|nr:HAMP domain-containing sensor histidine kinase [Gemmatimonadaceae bacterium]
MTQDEPRDTSLHLAPRAWLPLVFVVIALVLLFVTPLFVGNRVQHVRNDLFDVADQARVVVNDFEAAFATELIALRARSTNPTAADSTTTNAVRMERQQERALDSLASQLGPDAVERVVVLRAAEQRWREANYPNKENGNSKVSSDGEDGLAVLSSAEALDDYLLQVSNVARGRVSRLERINLISAAVLAAIALVAVAVVFMLDRQMRTFAGEAHSRARKLQRSVELRAALIRGVTHDIKNPLGAASGYADLLEEGVAGGMNPQQTEMVKRFKRLVGTAQQTVTELLELARVGGEELSVDARDVDLVALVRDVVSGYEAGATQKRISLSIHAPANGLRATTDPTHVRHVLDNLLSNAIKYTPPGGAVHVGMTADAENDNLQFARISVRDTGPGIAPAYRDRIFEEFFRIPTTNPDIPGSGLGLAISRRIARLLGGDITFSDAPEHGSIFTLVLPIAHVPGHLTAAGNGSDGDDARYSRESN